MTNLIGKGEIVGLIELSNEYLYDFNSFPNKFINFYISAEIQPPFV